MSRISGAAAASDVADLRLPFPRLPLPRLPFPRLPVPWPPFPRLTVIPPFVSLTWALGLASGGRANHRSYRRRGLSKALAKACPFPW
jgi:hypothetical protein